MLMVENFLLVENFRWKNIEVKGMFVNVNDTFNDNGNGEKFSASREFPMEEDLWFSRQLFNVNGKFNDNGNGGEFSTSGEFPMEELWG
jgi:hypothetical protein